MDIQTDRNKSVIINSNSERMAIPMKTFTNTMLIIVLITVAGCITKKTKAPEVDLFTAVVTDNLEAVQAHIKAGSDLNVKEPTRASTPLITAALLGKTRIALALIDAGADLNYQNSEGSTALITAAFFCRENIVRTLLDKGADKTLKNRAGHTALESVSRPFEEVKAVYDGLGTALEPLGLKLDYEHINATRPVIVEMLR